MKLINQYVDWIVAFALVFSSSFDVVRQGLGVMDSTKYLVLFTISEFIILLLLFIYQSQNYKSYILNRIFICFFILYHVKVFLDMTVFRVYPLEIMHTVPSIFGYFLSISKLILYLLCARTIVNHFNVRKFIFLAVIFAIIPSLFYINYIGVDTLQYFKLTHDDDEYLSGLTMGFTCVPLAVLSLFYYNTLFKSKIWSVLISVMIIIIVLYILIVVGKRGPMLWGIVNIYICYYLLTKIRFRFYMVFFIIGVSLYFAKDEMFNIISSYAPRTVERIQNSLENGDTDGRLDFNNAEQSTYLIGLKNFSESPLFGSYFRLKTNYQTYKGHYPHNIFVEILMTLGVIGISLFLYLLFKAYRNCRSIFCGKRMLSIFGFVIFFLSSFLMLQTSRTLLFRIDFWLSLYILCSLNRIIILNRDNKVLIKLSQQINK